MKNSILILQPYLLNGIWVFDDPTKGIKREPFVGQVNRWIDNLVKDIPGAEKGFNLLFSSEPFPEYAAEYDYLNLEFGGADYYHEESETIGWICSCLFIYFKEAPAKIYARAEPFRF